MTQPGPDRDRIGLAGLAEALTEDEMYGALVTFGSALTRARLGVVTEVYDRDGTVIALITPPRGRS